MSKKLINLPTFCVLADCKNLDCAVHSMVAWYTKLVTCFKHFFCSNEHEVWRRWLGKAPAQPVAQPNKMRKMIYGKFLPVYWQKPHRCYTSTLCLFCFYLFVSLLEKEIKSKSYAVTAMYRLKSITNY
jgi:hypothetical protein